VPQRGLIFFHFPPTQTPRLSDNNTPHLCPRLQTPQLRPRPFPAAGQNIRPSIKPSLYMVEETMGKPFRNPVLEYLSADAR